MSALYVFNWVSLTSASVSLFFVSATFFSPFQDILEGLVTIVCVKLDEEGWTEVIGVSNEAKHSHSHLS